MPFNAPTTQPAALCFGSSSAELRELTNSARSRNSSRHAPSLSDRDESPARSLGAAVVSSGSSGERRAAGCSVEARSRATSTTSTPRTCTCEVTTQPVKRMLRWHHEASSHL